MEIVIPLWRSIRRSEKHQIEAQVQKIPKIEWSFPPNELWNKLQNCIKIWEITTLLFWMNLKERDDDFVYTRNITNGLD